MTTFSWILLPVGQAIGDVVLFVIIQNCKKRFVVLGPAVFRRKTQSLATKAGCQQFYLYIRFVSADR